MALMGLLAMLSLAGANVTNSKRQKDTGLVTLEDVVLTTRSPPPRRNLKFGMESHSIRFLCGGGRFRGKVVQSVGIPHH